MSGDVLVAAGLMDEVPPCSCREFVSPACVHHGAAWLRERLAAEARSKLRELRAVFGAALANDFALRDISDDGLVVTFVRSGFLLEVRFCAAGMFRMAALFDSDSRAWRHHHPAGHPFDMVDRLIQSAEARS